MSVGAWLSKLALAWDDLSVGKRKKLARDSGLDKDAREKVKRLWPRIPHTMRVRMAEYLNSHPEYLEELTS